MVLITDATPTSGPLWTSTRYQIEGTEAPPRSQMPQSIHLAIRITVILSSECCSLAWNIACVEPWILCIELLESYRQHSVRTCIPFLTYDTCMRVLITRPIDYPFPL
ncbi:hypothetical protein RSAG8_13277, partial [Rhizoctonia solani AG-8 WAC10335]